MNSDPNAKGRDIDNFCCYNHSLYCYLLLLSISGFVYFTNSSLGLVLARQESSIQSLLNKGHYCTLDQSFSKAIL